MLKVIEEKQSEKPATPVKLTIDKDKLILTSKSLTKEIVTTYGKTISLPLPISL